MNTVILLRGKAATGKTTISTALRKKYSIPIVRKDDMFDTLIRHQINLDLANTISYDLLVDVIQNNIDAECDVIVDIGLNHTPYMAQFLSKINFKDSIVKLYYCDCSNHQAWEKRISDRFDSPKPNQLFQSTAEATEHYKNHDATLLPGEKVIDSYASIDEIINTISADIL